MHGMQAIRDACEGTESGLRRFRSAPSEHLREFAAFKSKEEGSIAGSCITGRMGRAVRGGPARSAGVHSLDQSEPPVFVWQRN